MWGAADKEADYPTHTFVEHNVPLDIAALKQESKPLATVFLKYFDVQLGGPSGVEHSIYRRRVGNTGHCKCLLPGAFAPAGAW